MTDNAGTGQDPAAPGETPDTQNAAEGQEPEEEQFDLDRAMRTIRALRAEAKAAKAQLKELDTLRSEREAARQAQLSKEEQLAQALAKAEAERDFALQEHKDAQRRHRVSAEAQRLGAVDPDAVVRLLDWDQIEYDDAGEPKDLSAAVGQLLKDKPYLTAQNGQGRPAMNATNPGTRHPGAQQKVWTRAEISDRAIWLAHRDEIMQAMRENRIAP